MKRSASLVLLELLIMLLVFSLAAALCVRAFSWADSRSRQSAAEDMALLQAQNAGELLKQNRGDLAAAAQTYGGSGGEVWEIFYDENWKVTCGPAAYTLRAELVATDSPLLGGAEVTVADGEGRILARLEIFWQEVAP